MPLRENIEKEGSMEIRKSNFNSFVYVKLTSEGLKMREQYIKDLWVNPEAIPLITDSEWYSEIQLYELMQIFWSYTDFSKLEEYFEMNFKIQLVKQVAEEIKPNWAPSVISKIRQKILL